jgi:hypothetical protein
MRKFTFVLIMMLAYAGFTKAQRMIDDFEPITMNLFSQGTNGSLMIVANPDPTGANTSAYVAKMVIGKQGRDPWAGWYATIPVKIDLTANPYVHIKVWKPRVSPTCFKVEGGAGNSGDTYPIADATETGKWVELVWNMSTTPATGEYEKIVLIPDFENPYLGTEDVTLYFDDMYVNNDPAVGSAPVQVIDNFETIEMNIMLGGADDLSSFSLIPNPDKSGVNLSDYVIKLNRDKDGVPWCGFWGHVYPPLDITGNKYVHAKVWKPRISPVYFKLEGGPGDPATSERESAYPQLTTNTWEDIVWDFTDMTDGAYPIIAFMTDKADPVDLTDDITIYFDDIRINNDPNPMTPPEQIIQVDMNGAGLVAGDKVYISGTLGGVYGTWDEPGKNPNNEMTDPDGDGIYTAYLHLSDGVKAFKFFVNGWGKGDPFTGGDRTYTFAGSANLVYTWGVGGVEVGVKQNPLAGKIQMYPNPVRDVLTVTSTSDIRKVVITNTLGKVVGNLTYTSNQKINTSNLSSGMYFVTFIGKDGNKVTQKLIKQ